MGILQAVRSAKEWLSRSLNGQDGEPSLWSKDWLHRPPQNSPGAWGSSSSETSQTKTPPSCTIEATVVRATDSGVTITLVCGGRIIQYDAPRHVAAGLIGKLADALA